MAVQRQRALYMRATWVRGANFVARIRLYDAAGQYLDLSSWPQLRFGLEGEQGARALSPYIAVQYDVDRGGAAEGALKATVFEDGLELDRTGQRSTVIFSIAARRFMVEDLPLVQCRLSVRESALR